jgi:hypothetical protein
LPKYVEEYYQKYLELAAKLNSNSPFYNAFINAIKSGNNQLARKETKETTTFDEEWIDKINTYLNSIENICLKPRRFMKDVQEVVPTELAKKTTKDAIRHLAQNTQYIREVSDDGFVIPKKVLTTYKDEDLEIYENRFVSSALTKLTIFIERRYQAILKIPESYKQNDLKLNSQFAYEDSEFNIELKIGVKEKMDYGLESKNSIVIEKITKLRERIRRINGTSFMKSLASSKKVSSPIMKTNIILKEPNYHSVYNMWLFMDTYNTLGFKVSRRMKNLILNDDYIEDIYNLVALNSIVSAVNEESVVSSYESLPEKEKIEKSIKPATIEDKVEIFPDYEMENYSINEYYFNKSKGQMKSEIAKSLKSGKSKEEAYQKILRTFFNINEKLLNDVISENEEKYEGMSEVEKEYALMERQIKLYNLVRSEKSFDLLKTAKEIKNKRKDLKILKLRIGEQKLLEKEEKRYINACDKVNETITNYINERNKYENIIENLKVIKQYNNKIANQCRVLENKEAQHNKNIEKIHQQILEKIKKVKV